MTGALDMPPESDGDGRGDAFIEIASLLARGYLRLLLHVASEPPTPDVCAPCVREDSAPSAHEELDVSAAQRDQL